MYVSWEFVPKLLYIELPEVSSNCNVLRVQLREIVEVYSTFLM